jgi:hypothetical protein
MLKNPVKWISLVRVLTLNKKKERKKVFKPDADLLPLQLCESTGIIYSFAYLQPKNASCGCSSCNGG